MSFDWYQGSRVPAEGCRYRYMYRQMEKCRYRTVRTGGLGLIIMIYWGKGYLAWYQGCIACDTAIQLLYNDGCTAARSPYPYEGIVNAYYDVTVALLLVCLQHAGERSWPRWQAAKNPPEQLKIKKCEKTRFHVLAPPKICRYCTGKTKDAGMPVRRSPRTLIGALDHCAVSAQRQTTKISRVLGKYAVPLARNGLHVQ
jgi:hypothetical protein